MVSYDDDDFIWCWWLPRKVLVLYADSLLFPILMLMIDAYADNGL